MDELDGHILKYDEFLTLQNYSEQTKRMYLGTLSHFLIFRESVGLSGVLKGDDARRYLLYRIKLKKKWSTINCDYSGLIKFYKLLNIEWNVEKIPRPRRELKLPEILSQEDVQRLIEHAALYKHQVFLTFVYGTGLRLSEALNIKFEDIDGDRLQIKVRGGKGGKDRYVQMPMCLLDLLRDYYRRVKPEVFLFNGIRGGTRYSASAGQWCLKEAKRCAGIKKSASVHTLRHCYATHHIENGTDLVYLQEQLGHKHIRTTVRYVQVCLERRRNVNHPLARMAIKYR